MSWSAAATPPHDGRGRSLASAVAPEDVPCCCSRRRRISKASLQRLFRPLSEFTPLLWAEAVVSSFALCGELEELTGYHAGLLEQEQHLSDPADKNPGEPSIRARFTGVDCGEMLARPSRCRFPETGS